MCAITGFLTFDSYKVDFDRIKVIEKMIAAVHHRGPDDDGFYLDEHIALGHARLSIIDLSKAANQPMASEDQNFHIVFNGEIYNFQNIREDLIKSGFIFRTNSDTEVLLYGYQKWGKELFIRLNGMFALAIWDRAKQELILARDRFGEKPLYFCELNSIFIFGSEIKAILQYPGFKREVNYEAIHHYLTFQYVPSNTSAFKGVHKLMPGSWMAAGINGQKVTRKYWEVPRDRINKRNVRQEDVDKELQELLASSVKARMVADVPVGAFLSGGVDSSSVVAMMSIHSNQKIKTFTAGFEEASYDERKYAREVANIYQTDHHELEIKVNFEEIIPELASTYCEPFGDSSALPSYCLSRYVKNYVDVALSGDGADELFLGYQRYTIFSKIQAPKKYMAKNILKLAQNRSNGKTLKEYNFLSRYEPYIAYFSEWDKFKYYDDNMRNYLELSSLELLLPDSGLVNNLAVEAGLSDLTSYLPGDILTKIDIASMAHGLEARNPYLDYDLADWALSLPLESKINRQGGSKAILKKSMEPFLPKDILHRKKKGFSIPAAEWFRSELKEFAYDMLLSKRARDRGIFKVSYVAKMLDEHVAGRWNHDNRLWALLMLEFWFRKWIDQDPNC